MKSQKVLVKNLYKDSSLYSNQAVQISGWIRTIRDSKNFGFIELNDGRFFKNIQIVFDTNLSNLEEVKKLTISSSITCLGNI